MGSGMGTRGVQKSKIISRELDIREWFYVSEQVAAVLLVIANPAKWANSQ